jgi:GTP-binding protein EngB required for normal cell division
MDVQIEGVSVGVGGIRARRAKPKGLYGLITHALGKEILVLGPSTAGKSKFTEYLRLGTLDTEGQREMTYHVRKTPAFTLGLGDGNGFTLRVRRAVDTPGQVGPLQHATLVGRRKPHAVIIVLDCSRSILMMITWLHLFCDRLDTVLRRGSYAKRKLSEVVVLLNKRDKIDDDSLEQLKYQVRGALRQHLSVPLGSDRVNAIPIMECISVQTEYGTDLIDRVVTELGARLGR